MYSRNSAHCTTGTRQPQIFMKDFIKFIVATDYRCIGAIENRATTPFAGSSTRLATVTTIRSWKDVPAPPTKGPSLK